MLRIKRWYLSLPLWLRVVIIVILITLLPVIIFILFLLAFPALIVGIIGAISGKIGWGPFATKTGSAIVAGISVVMLIAGSSFAAANGHSTPTTATSSSASSILEDPSTGSSTADSILVDSDSVPSTSANPDTTVTGTSMLSTETAAAVLATLPIKGRAPKTGYTRSQFGEAWADIDHNGCDTRNDILQRDLTNVVHKDSCKIASGTLLSAYSGSTVDFVRGTGTSEKVQIDHVVALSDAWQKGAQQITPNQREELANDPLNLQAIEGSLNDQKSDSDAASWLPPLKSYRCEYVARQVSIKSIYGLWVTQAEHDAIAGILATCPEQKAYASGYASTTASTATQSTTSTATTLTPTSATAAPTPAPAVTSAAAPTPTPTTPATSDNTDVYYKNCAEVRAAGKAPLYRGQPGYSSKLDRDNDGVACE